MTTPSLPYIVQRLAKILCSDVDKSQAVRRLWLGVEVRYEERGSHLSGVKTSILGLCQNVSLAGNVQPIGI
jgi:hypothetical protein